MKKLIWALLPALLINCLSAKAQKKTTFNKSWQFKSINTIGWVGGQSGGALQLLTVNGVQHGQWFAGIGTGIDNYRLRSVPLFAEVRTNVNTHLFVYADAGLNWYWQKATDIKQFIANDQYKSGFYGETGIGYAVYLHRGLSLLFSGGYSLKNLTEQGHNYWYGTGIITGVYNPPYTLDKINYHLNRVVLKAGIKF